MSSMLRSSKFLRYFVGLARNIVISNRQEVDRNLLQGSQHLANVFSRNFTSNLNFQAGSPLERTVRRLDEDARRTGRISLKEVEEALSELRRSKSATATQSLMVIRCCGNLVPEETPEHRTKLVDEIWNTLEKLGVSLDISHYNALLKVYLENEHKFSPTEFLAKLEQKGVEPNRVTYQRLVAGYCQTGDIAGATKILEYMKNKQLPVSEGVFNALILGHAQAHDMESAEGMLGVMRQASLEPSNETYATLLSGYAQHGDKAAIDRILTECKLKDIMFSDKDILDIVYVAAISGHDALVGELLKNCRCTVGYNQDAANVLLRLINRRKDEAAYKVFLTMQKPVRSEGIPNMSGHFIIKQYTKMNRSVEDILSLCDRLAKDGHTTHGLFVALDSSFHNGNVDLTLNLLRALKQTGEPIRMHYFWPALCAAGKSGDNNRSREVLKVMVNEFSITPNSETLIDYYFPYIAPKSTDQLLSELLELGVRPGQAVVGLLLYYISQNKLKQALDLALKNPGLNLRSVFLTRRLVDSIQQTGDVKSVVSLVHIITSNRASSRESREEEEEDTPPIEELAGAFLIGVVNDLQTRPKTVEVLKEMLEHGLSISNRAAEIVENRLQGTALTTEISTLLAKLSSGDLALTELSRPPRMAGPKSNIQRDPAMLERIQERFKQTNAPIEKQIGIVRAIFQAYCFVEDIENALRVKQEWIDMNQEVTPGMWAQLLGVYCGKEDLEGAKTCLDNLRKSISEFELDITKLLKMAKLYVQNNQLDEAINLLKESKCREEKEFATRAASWQLLMAVAETTKDPEQVKQFLDILVNGKFIEITNVMLGPIIKAYMLRDDLEGALKEFEYCVKMYRATPWKNEITTQLIEKEDAANLQTLVDLSTQIHGEINSLYDLVFSFVECGRFRQARKILETPGLTSRTSRLHTACERYRNEGNVSSLEALVEVTKDLSFIDRSEIYYNLLDTYCQTDNVDKALGLWTQMQDEDVNVSDDFLIKLGGFLKSKGLQVPFEVPKQDLRVNAAEQVSEQVRQQQQQPTPLSAAIKAKDLDKALKIKESLDNSGKQLTRNEVTKLLELLIEQNRLREATTLVTSLTENQFPVVQTVSYLLLRLSLSGEIDMLQRVGEHLNENVKRMISFNNRRFSCAVVAGKAKEELDKLDKEIDNAATSEEIDELSRKFPIGGILGLLESPQPYIEQVTRLAEKYFNKGSIGPVNALCMFYLSQGQFDKAKEMYERYNLGNSSKIMFRNVLRKAKLTKNPVIVEELLGMVKDAPSITPEVKGLIYSNLLDIYMMNDDFESAMTKLEESLKSTELDKLHRTTLTTLKNGLEAKNIPFKYTIPTKKTKDLSSSSSSSSSDLEANRSVAAKH